MGRPRKPTNLRVLEGNPSKRPLPQNEPKPVPIAPKCPSWANRYGKRLWKELIPEMERLGLVTKIDGASFAAMCHSYGVWVECEQYLKKHGRTYEYTNKAGETNMIARPEVAIGQKALAEFRRWAAEFGLTPAARTKIEVKVQTEEDPMEVLLNRSGG